MGISVLVKRQSSLFYEPKLKAYYRTKNNWEPRGGSCHDFPVSAKTVGVKLFKGVSYFHFSYNILSSDALEDVGFFPVGCLTEDTLLSLRLCTMGWAVSYHHEVLAIGQSPHELTEIFKQRSRWCKVFYFYSLLDRRSEINVSEKKIITFKKIIHFRVEKEV